ncbi:MAG: alginate lyase family protein [Nibricoccus sp.]
MKNRILTGVLALLLSSLVPVQSLAFSHPGMLHTAADFTRMQTKVNASSEPWLSGWNKLLANSHSSSSYTMQGPVATVYRGADGTHAENYSKLFNDIAAAYQNALRWKIAGTTANADKAVQILNAWSSTLTSIGGTSDKYLAAGIYGYQFANVAEIMRSYSGWSAANQTAFKNMMLNVFYPMNHDFLVNHNGACISHYWANWDACNMASILAIGILCDDTAKFNEAINYFKNGAGNGKVSNAAPFVYNTTSGGIAQCQESGRDQGHSCLDVSLFGSFCQMAYNQGQDMFSYNPWGDARARMHAMFEYIAEYNLGNSVPYTTYNNCDNVNQTVISSTSRGDIRPSWELLYAHYVKLKGLSSNYIQQYAGKTRPEGGGGDYGPNSGGFDQLGFGTLTFAR